MMSRQGKNWLTVTFSAITLVLLLGGILVTGQSLQQQVRNQSTSLEDNLIRAIHDLNQLQREIRQLQILVSMTESSLDLNTFQQQLDITQSRFTVIKRRQQTQNLDIGTLNILKRLDQTWSSLKQDLQSWSQQPTNQALKQTIFDSLNQLEIDANRATIFNTEQQWDQYQSLVRHSSYSLQLLRTITILFLCFSLIFGFLLTQFIMNRQRLLKELERSATIDDLTNIPNRRYFNKIFEQEWQRMRRDQCPLSLLICDVDHFKRYNDHYGHQAGDQCLTELAAIFAQCMRRPGDLAARYGGEEFIILLPNTHLHGAQQQADFLQRQLHERALPHGDSPISDQITISIGIVSKVPQLNEQAANMIAAADKALYQAKENGRNCSCQYGGYC